ADARRANRGLSLVNHGRVVRTVGEIDDVETDSRGRIDQRRRACLKRSRRIDHQIARLEVAAQSIRVVRVDLQIAVRTRRGDRLKAGGTKAIDDLTTEESGAAEDDDAFHWRAMAIANGINETISAAVAITMPI